MTEVKVKRSKFAIFLNTTPATTATYSLVGTGFTSAMINYNPEVVKEGYIHQDNKVSSVDSYAIDIPLEGKFIKGNAAQDFIETLRRARATGSAAETDCLLVYEYETPVSTDQYPAEKQPIVISFETFGGEGAAYIESGCTLHGNGDPTQGLYDFSANSFTAS